MNLLAHYSAGAVRWDPPKVAPDPPPPDPPPPPEPPPSPDQTGGGVLFFGFGSFAAIDGLGVSPTGDSVEPDPLKNKHLRLAGGGHLGGGGFQIDIFGKYVRGGVGVSVFGVEGTRLVHDRLANGFSTAPSSGWGAGFDVFVGMKAEVAVPDVFALHRVVRGEGGGAPGKPRKVPHVEARASRFCACQVRSASRRPSSSSATTRAMTRGRSATLASRNEVQPLRRGRCGAADCVAPVAGIAAGVLDLVVELARALGWRVIRAKRLDDPSAPEEVICRPARRPPADHFCAMAGCTDAVWAERALEMLLKDLAAPPAASNP